MKKLTLLLFLVLSNLISKAGIIEDMSKRQCIEYDANSGKFYLKIDFVMPEGDLVFDPLAAKLHYPGLDNYVYLKAPGATSWIGPFPFAYANSPGTVDWTEYFDITTPGGYDENLCYETAFISFNAYNIATGLRVDLATATSLHLNPEAPGKYPIVPLPGGIQYWIRHTYKASDRIFACKCAETEWPTCDAEFTFKLSIDSKGIAPMIGNIYPKTFHPGSSYVYNYGGGYTSPVPISKIYTPGIYTVCLKETTINGQICEKCVNICVPDPTAVLSNYTISGGGISGTPNPTHDPVLDPCNPEFTFVYTTNSEGTPPNNGTIFLDDFHATSTYSYDWGDGLVTPDPISKIYSPGNYTVCVTETRNDGSFCKKCIQICVTDPTPSIFTPFRESNDNTITGSGMMENKISISPNPTYSNATINLELVQKDNVHVMVIDMTGKKVSEIFNGSLAEGVQKLNINTDNFASGLYQVQVMIGNKMSTHKLSVVK